MAGGEVIGAAIGILLLILVGYIMVGSTLSSADIVVSAQKDVTLQNEVRLNTLTAISGVTFTPVGTPPLYTLDFNLKNTGNEVITDLKHIDVFLTIADNSPVHLSHGTEGYPNNWAYSGISGNLLDLDKTMSVTINNIPADAKDKNYKILVITANGVPKLVSGTIS